MWGFMKEVGCEQPGWANLGQSKNVLTISQSGSCEIVDTF